MAICWERVDQLPKRTFRSRYAHTPVTEHSEGPVDTFPSRERAVLLAFRLFCFTLCRLKYLYWCLGHDVKFSVIDSWSLPFHLFWEDYIHYVPQYHILPSYLEILRILTYMHISISFSLILLNILILNQDCLQISSGCACEIWDTGVKSPDHCLFVYFEKTTYTMFHSTTYFHLILQLSGYWHVCIIYLSI